MRPASWIGRSGSAQRNREELLDEVCRLVWTVLHPRANVRLAVIPVESGRPDAARGPANS